MGWLARAEDEAASASKDSPVSSRTTPGFEITLKHGSSEDIEAWVPGYASPAMVSTPPGVLRCLLIVTWTLFSGEYAGLHSIDLDTVLDTPERLARAMGMIGVTFTFKVDRTEQAIRFTLRGAHIGAHDYRYFIKNPSRQECVFGRIFGPF